MRKCWYPRDLSFSESHVRLNTSTLSCVSRTYNYSSYLESALTEVNLLLICELTLLFGILIFRVSHIFQRSVLYISDQKRPPLSKYKDKRLVPIDCVLPLRNRLGEENRQKMPQKVDYGYSFLTKADWKVRREGLY